MIKALLRVWGWICLLWAAVVLICYLYAAFRPSVTISTGSTGLAEWIGMGLLSLGTARIIDLFGKEIMFF